MYATARVRDATATYIYKAGIPSRMYAKYQYSTWVTVQKYVVIYIPTEKSISMQLSQNVT